MKKILLFKLMVLGMLLIVCDAVDAQNLEAANINVTARLAEKTVIENIKDVDFGGIFADPNGGVIKMDNEGNISSTSNATFYGKELVKTGGFEVLSGESTHYSVSLNTDKGSIPLTGGVNNSVLKYIPVFYKTGTNELINIPGDFSGEALAKGVTIAGDLDIPGKAGVGTYKGVLVVSVTMK